MRFPNRYLLVLYSCGIGLVAVIPSVTMLYLFVELEDFIAEFGPCVIITFINGTMMSYIMGYKVREVQRLTAQLRRLVNRDTVTGTMSRRRLLELADEDRSRGPSSWWISTISKV